MNHAQTPLDEDFVYEFDDNQICWQNNKKIVDQKEEINKYRAALKGEEWSAN